MSGGHLLPLADARAFVLSRVSRLPAVEVPVGSALGKVLAAPITSDCAVPPFDNSAMDGFAVRAEDVITASATSPIPLDVIATIAAGGQASCNVGAGETARIMTGAPMPPGADAVVMVERTCPAGDATVHVLGAVSPGTAIRLAATDVAVGDLVLDAGAELGPAHLSLLATVGQASVEAIRRPLVGVLSTGDELVPPGLPLGQGQIYDSNRVGLLAQLHDSGFETADLGCVPDDPAAIEVALREGVARCDAVLSSGGVSMGDYDHVKVVLDQIGDMRWMQIAIKPAKPFAFGLVDGTPVFGLPGNPVSSMVSFELLARPALRRMAGHAVLERPMVRAQAEHDFERRPDGKIHFARAVVTWDDDGQAWVRSAGGQASYQLTAMAAANALAEVADGDGARAGERLPCWLLGPPTRGVSVAA